MFTNNLCQAAEKKKGSHFKPFDKDKFITRDFKAKRIFLFEWSYPQKNRRHCSFSNENHSQDREPPDNQLFGGVYKEDYRNLSP